MPRCAFFRKLLAIGDEALQAEVRRVAQGLEPGESYAVGYERSVLLRGAGETASLRNARAAASLPEQYENGRPLERENIAH